MYKSVYKIPPYPYPHLNPIATLTIVLREELELDLNLLTSPLIITIKTEIKVAQTLTRRTHADRVPPSGRSR